MTDATRSVLPCTFMLSILACGCDLTLPTVNQSPTADAGPNQNVVANSTVTLTGLASTDPDGDPLTYFWQQTAGPSLSIPSPNSATIEIVPPEEGVYTLVLTVTDDRGGSDDDTVLVFVSSPGCQNSADCDDGDACTDDACVDGTCNNTPLDCDDDDACTTDACVDGACDSTQTDCDDGDVCTDDSCADDGCVNAAIDGCCNEDADCAEGEICVDNTCVPACEDDADCDDGDTCNGDEMCVDGACLDSTAVDCDDGDGCTDDSCSDGNCENTPVACPDGEACVDGTCQPGQCTDDADCDDADACTTDTCDDAICNNAAIDGCCNTDDDCAEGESCDANECVGACTDDAGCTDDGLFCNGTESCVNGACASSGDPCTDDQTCNEDTDTCAPDVSEAYGWTRTLGGAEFDGATSVAVDTEGNVVLTGYFRHIVDFDPTDGVDERIAVGDNDMFITKLDSDGGYTWTRTIGGPESDIANAIALDNAGNIVITGQFKGTVDFDTTFGDDEHTAVGWQDIFVTKLTVDGAYGWTRTFGGSAFTSASDTGLALAVDTAGNVMVTGGFASTVDFDPSDEGVDEHTANGRQDVFVTKFDPNGAHLWTRTFGGSEGDLGQGVSFDSTGSVVITGYFESTVDFDPTDGVDERESNGLDDIFITKLNADGSYAWTATIGSSENDGGYAIAADANANVLVTGKFTGTLVDFDPTAGVDLRSSNGITDIFITKLSAVGSYAWTVTIGGISYDQSGGIAVAPSGNVIAGGDYSGPVDFDPTGSGDEFTNDGLFLTERTSEGAYVQTRVVVGAYNCCTVNIGVAVDQLGNPVVADSFHGTLDFDPTDGVDSHTANGSYDIFVTKLNDSP